MVKYRTAFKMLQYWYFNWTTVCYCPPKSWNSTELCNKPKIQFQQQKKTTSPQNSTYLAIQHMLNVFTSEDSRSGKWWYSFWLKIRAFNNTDNINSAYASSISILPIGKAYESNMCISEKGSLCTVDPGFPPNRSPWRSVNLSFLFIWNQFKKENMYHEPWL